MYTQLLRQLVLSAPDLTPVVQVTPAIELVDANAVELEFVVEAINGTGASLFFRIEGGNDRENWSTLVTSAAITSVRLMLTGKTPIECRFVRLTVVFSVSAGSGAAIVNASVNTAEL